MTGREAPNGDPLDRIEQELARHYQTGDYVALGILGQDVFPALVAVARAARYYLAQTAANLRGTPVRDLDEAHEALRAALARLEEAR